MRGLRNSMRVNSGSEPLAFSGLILWSIMWTGCFQPQDFEVRSVSISDFRSLGDEATVVGIDIGLHNPNGYKVDIQERVNWAYGWGRILWAFCSLHPVNAWPEKPMPWFDWMLFWIPVGFLMFSARIGLSFSSKEHP